MKVGSLVRLDEKKYNKPTSEMLGIVSKIDDSHHYVIVQVAWVGDREETSHLPTDLELVR